MNLQNQKLTCNKREIVLETVLKIKRVSKKSVFWVQEWFSAGSINLYHPSETEYSLYHQWHISHLVLKRNWRKNITNFYHQKKVCFKRLLQWQLVERVHEARQQGKHHLGPFPIKLQRTDWGRDPQPLFSPHPLLTQLSPVSHHTALDPNSPEHVLPTVGWRKLIKSPVLSSFCCLTNP